MSKSALIIILLLPLLSAASRADWRDLLDALPDSAQEAVNSIDAKDAAGLSTPDIVAGLKEALDKATEIAVNELSKEGGFLDNPQVRIPLPEQLQWGSKEPGQDWSGTTGG